MRFAGRGNDASGGGWTDWDSKYGSGWKNGLGEKHGTGLLERYDLVYTTSEILYDSFVIFFFFFLRIPMVSYIQLFYRISK